MTDIFTPPAPLQTAVLFLVFNRPDTTAQVFEAIRKAKPPRLYIAADGARADREGEAEKVSEVREIATAVDWSCEVKTLFRQENLGCKHAVSGGITWFFEHEEQGIILEDDCLPSQSFFWFCEELLVRYKDETRVMHIAGMCYREPSTNYSYNFVRIGGIWGWASWRRAWALYDPNFELMEEALEEGVIENIFFGNPYLIDNYKKFLTKAHKNQHTWDYQWSCAKLINASVNVMPSVNLVENIGIEHSDSTHMVSDASSRFANIRRKDICFPLRCRKFLVINQETDISNLRFTNQKQGFVRKVIRKLSNIY